MTPEQRQINDQYPGLITALTSWANQITQAPLDEMRQVADRIGLTSVHIRPGRSPEIVDAKVLAQHRRVIDLATKFRDDWQAFVREVSQAAEPPAPGPVDTAPSPDTIEVAWVAND